MLELMLLSTQICHLTFGSWTRGTDTLVLALPSQDIAQAYRYARTSGARPGQPAPTTGTINLANLTATTGVLRSSPSGLFKDQAFVQYTLTLCRTKYYYIFNFILPTTVISVLAL